MIEPSELERRLKEAFPDAEIKLEDLTGTKDHYQAEIVSSAFDGATPIAQHQMVYRALAEEMKGPIHALSLKTMSPAAAAATRGVK